MRQYNWVYLMVGLGYLWVLWNFLIPSDSQVTVCLFKHATGFACPSCGSTRSVLSILHGNLTQAWMMNPLGYIGLCIMIMVPVLGVLGKLKRSDLLTKTMRYLETAIRKPHVALPLALIVVANWIWNITKGL